MTSRSLEQIFKIYDKQQDFGLGDLFGVTNYMLNLNNYSTKAQVFDLELLLDMVY